jgi:hypothetical protein
MLTFILLIVDWPSLAGHFSFYLFGLVAAAIGVGAVYDLLCARRQTAKPQNAPMLFMSRYRDEHGMPIFFEAGEDPSARSAQRVLAQQRREARVL